METLDIQTFSRFEIVNTIETIGTVKQKKSQCIHTFASYYRIAYIQRNQMFFNQ